MAVKHWNGEHWVDNRVAIVSDNDKENCYLNEPASVIAVFEGPDMVKNLNTVLKALGRPEFVP